MSNRYREKMEREQLHCEINGLESNRFLNEEHRAKLARTARHLVHETYGSSDPEAWRQALTLEQRALVASGWSMWNW